MPTAASPISLSVSQTLAWDCGRQSVTASGWTFPAVVGSCPVSTTLAQEGGVGLVTAAPGDFRSTVVGTTVRLEWNAVFEGTSSYRIEAGSAPTLANLAILNTGNTLTVLTVTNVPDGVYYVRVRAVGNDGIPGPSSNEIVVRVGAACAAPPGSPTG